jgi:hypothetical protein
VDVGVEGLEERMAGTSEPESVRHERMDAVIESTRLR